MHLCGIMHRDIKPANIIFQTPECKKLIIADFGLSQQLNSNDYLFPRAGTPGYVAPEIARNVQNNSSYN